VDDKAITGSICQILSPPISLTASWEAAEQAYEIGRFFTLIIQVRNRTDAPVRLHLQIQPYQVMFG